MNTNATQRTDPTREAVLGAARAIQHVTATEGENALVGEWNRFQAALDAALLAAELRGAAESKWLREQLAVQAIQLSAIRESGDGSQKAIVHSVSSWATGLEKRFFERIDELKDALAWLLDDVMDDELEFVGKSAEGVAKARAVIAGKEDADER